MDEIGVGVIGTGFMGECHALAYLAATPLFQPRLRPRLELVADVVPEAAARARARFGFARATTDWQALIEDPAVGVVSITSPNVLHKEMAMAAIAAGKHVWCEKPLALTAADARELAEAAEAKGVRTLVGYNYLRSPAVQYMKRLIDSGELGALTYVRAAFDEDYMADPDVPWSWRCDRARAGSGTLGDMGSHAISMLRHLVGPIIEVLADFRTVIAERPMPAAGGAKEERAGKAAIDRSRMTRVENDDVVLALVRFADGTIGQVGSARIAWGRKNGPDLEIYGSRGSLRFTQERMNELQLFRPSERADDNGFRTILTGPAHPPYGRFTPGTGHGLGFNDLKTIEAAHLLDGIAAGTPLYPDFREGWAVEAVCDAMIESAARGTWVRIEEVG